MQAMRQAGILGEREAIELIDGDLVVPPAEGPPHANTTVKLARRLMRAYPEADFVIRINNPLVLSDRSEPQPDLVVVAGQENTFATQHPTGHEALLVIEIADSSLKLDQQMSRLYAQGGVPHYWILDLQGRRVEQFSDPVPGEQRYRWTREDHHVVLFPNTNVELRLRDLFGDDQAG